ncbi:hypothetical protein OJJOAM_002947 [Cupriavidus sp. H18C1]
MWRFSGTPGRGDTDARAMHWRRTGRPVFWPADEAAGSAPRGGGGRAQPSLRHLRLGRGVLGRHHGQPARGRSGERARDRRGLQSLGRHRHPLPRPHDALQRARLHRHRPQAPAEHPAGALRGAGRGTGVRDRRAGRPGAGRDIPRRPGDRLGRRQQPRAHPLRRDLRAGHRYAPVPLRLARHQKALRRLYLRLRTDRARLVPGARLPLRRRHLDLYRRDAGIGLARRRHRADGPAAGHRLLRAAVRKISRWPALDQQRHPSARLGQLDPLQPRDLQHLGPLEHAGRRPPRAGGADGRCRPHRAFLDRLGHQAGAGGCDRLGQQPARHGATRPGRPRRGAAPLRGDPQRRGAEDPERRAQFHRMVRERRALCGSGARAVRLFAADALAAHFARESAAARSHLCRGLRALAGAAGRRARGKPARA